MKVEDIELRRGMTVNDLIKELNKSGGFTAKDVALAVEIFEEMVRDEDCTVFLSFPACIVATGTRGVIRDLVRLKLVDVVVTTCGTIDHDLARIWRDYYHGSFSLDDVELYRSGFHRIGNIKVPRESYGVLEEKIHPILEEIYREKKRLSTRELIWEVGRRIEFERNAESSIVYWCYKNKIPIFVPGITDGSFGCQLWMFYQTHRDFTIDVLRDEDELCEIVFEAERTGALIVGGGISKHHTIWWNQFVGGLDFAIYITTAVEWDGSLSGARVGEAISWGKVNERAKYVNVYGDATVILPLIFASLLERF
ncbi:MAG: deoxyhypusine synthase [Archaeoglobales archaeon]|nr:MAG: deoxyhypusine synthase [Archaeoglobales archaeon]